MECPQPPQRIKPLIMPLSDLGLVPPWTIGCTALYSSSETIGSCACSITAISSSLRLRCFLLPTETRSFLAPIYFPVYRSSLSSPRTIDEVHFVYPSKRSHVPHFGYCRFLYCAGVSIPSLLSRLAISVAPHPCALISNNRFRTFAAGSSIMM